jgi:hypothetical protein
MIIPITHLSVFGTKAKYWYKATANKFPYNIDKNTNIIEKVRQIILIAFKTLKVIPGKGVNSLSPQENTKNTISKIKNIIGNTNKITPRLFSRLFKLPITEVL